MWLGDNLTSEIPVNVVPRSHNYCFAGHCFKVASRSAIYCLANGLNRVKSLSNADQRRKRQIGMPLEVLSRKTEGDFNKTCNQQIIDSQNMINTMRQHNMKGRRKDTILQLVKHKGKLP